MTTKRAVAALVTLATLGVLAGCSRPPGKPKAEERWVPPAQITDFNQLYSQNCAGCHGTDGRLGSAPPLNDPLYLAVANADALREVTAKGVAGTAMPPFAEQSGGSLTDKQIDALVEGMRSQWGRPNDFKDVALPPYSLQDAINSGSGPGDTQRGTNVFATYCAQCHGADGRGGAKGGSVVNPNFLALASDQSLRTTTIVGRPDLGKPDWRANVSAHPMSPQEISDVVAWLVSQRGNKLVVGQDAANSPVSSTKVADGLKRE
jgi:cytochrome c oxidase cbb3-type subunit III